MAAFGIDFGTTNSVLAAVSAGTVETVALDDPPGEFASFGFDRVLPTVLAEHQGQILHGWRAKRSSARLDAVKRLFTSDDDVRIGAQTFAIEEAAGIFFREIKARASRAGLTLDQAVVTIPANSRGKARSRTKVSAGLSGIEVLALLNEPTAAAMAYSRHIDDDQRVLVFDWGGGTLDVTVLRSVNGVFVEEASKGIQRLGGIDVDEAFGRVLRARVPAGAAVDPFDLERAKVALSSQPTTTLSLIGGGLLEVTRGELEDAIRPLVLRTREPIDRCLADLGHPRVDHLVLVGGSSKIPAVQSFVREVVRLDPMEGVDPMTAVAEGAAVAAGILKEEINDLDFFVGIEHALGTIVHNEGESAPRFSVLIGRNTMLPAEHSDTFTPVLDFQESVLVRVIEGDPDQPVDHEDNVILEQWDLQLPEKRPRSESSIGMRYRYDVDGILHVTVTDVKTGAVILDEEVRQGAAKDRRRLVEMRRRVEGVGTADGAPAGSAANDPVAALDLESTALIAKAQTKVIPFLDDQEAGELRSLVAALEAAGAEGRLAARESLDRAVRQHAYLL